MNNENLITIRTRAKLRGDLGEARSHRSTNASSFCGIREKVIAVEAIEERELTGIARRRVSQSFAGKGVVLATTRR